MHARRRSSIAIVALLAACSSPATVVPADTIFVGGRVLTLDAEGRRAEALAVRGRRIAAVGSEDDLLALQGADTRIIDLEGRVLAPGFVDTRADLLRRAGSDPGRIEAQAAEYARAGITTIQAPALSAAQVVALGAVANSLRLATDAVAFPNWEAIGELHDELEDMDCVGSFRVGGIEVGSGSPSSDELNARLRQCFEQGWHVEVIVDDQVSVDALVAALRDLRAALPQARPRVVATLRRADLRDDQLDALRELEVFVAVSPSPLAARAAERGLRISLHEPASDRIAAPLELVAAAIRSGMPAERALRAVTIDAARQLRVDGRKGSLEVGKLADLVLLSADPTQDGRPASIEVLAVHKAGARVE